VAAVASEVVTRPSTAVLSGVPGEEPATIVPPRERQRLARLLSGDLDTIVLTALRREPERRYPSVAALAEDLVRFLGGLPIRARADSVGYRARKFVGRHRLAVGAATVAVVALVASLLVALWQADRARQAAAAARAAEGAARTAASAAREEAARSQAIAAFLTDVFTAADPEGKRAVDLTAGELVQRGAAQIDRRLEQQPATRAAMLHVLGGMQYRLGLYEPARELLEKALELRRRLSPAAPAEVAATALSLGEVYHRQGRSADALPLMAEALAYQDRHDRTGHEQVRVLSDIANVYRALHRDDDARRAFERAIAILDRQPDADPSLHAKVLNNYGLFLDRSLRQSAPAMLAFERALALHERTSGPDSALVSGTLSNLAEVYIRLGEVERAVGASRRALAISEKTYGPQHASTAISVNGLGWALLAAGEPAEARPLFERALAIQRGAFGEQHQHLGYSYRNLGQALAESGHPDEAIAALRRAERVWQATLGPDAAELGTVYLLLAPLLAAQASHEAAEGLLLRTVELWEPAGNHRFKLGEAWLALARVRLARCALGQARAALRSAQIEAASYPAGKWVAALPALEREVASARCAAR
jgi:serine/threonine-protein kinase